MSAHLRLRKGQGGESGSLAEGHAQLEAGLAWPWGRCAGPGMAPCWALALITSVLRSHVAGLQPRRAAVTGRGMRAGILRAAAGWPRTLAPGLSIQQETAASARFPPEPESPRH